jgi:hypothetical protein
VLIPHLPSLSSLQATNHRHNNSKESGKERLQSAEAAVGWEDISMQSTTGHTTLCISSQVGTSVHVVLTWWLANNCRDVCSMRTCLTMHIINSIFV